jgi:hypothetical protein
MKTNHKHQKISGPFTVLALLIATWSCTLANQTGEIMHESQAIALGGIESVTVNLKMGAGELTILGGADSLVDADFTYNVPDWKPTLDYVVDGKQGILRVEQPKAENIGLDTYRYEWYLRFNEGVTLTSLKVELGAGKSQIDLSRLSLTEFDLQMGVGDVEIDFTGERSSDINAIIRGGVGQLTVLLPRDVGVLVEASGGLVNITTDGLQTQGESYVNNAYGETETIIILNIEGGIGEIDLRVVE